MDTVTRAPMAIVQAEEGGIGIIDRGFRPGEIGPQVREVEIVKRTQHGVIARSLQHRSVGASLRKRRALMARSRVGTLVVVDEGGRLLGLLTERDLRFADDSRLQVSDRMTPLAQLVVYQGTPTADEAERVMVERKVKKLPLVNADGVLQGLITAKDLIAPTASPVRDARRTGPPDGRRRDRRNRRLPRTRG